jgi:hypothetical protein
MSRISIIFFILILGNNLLFAQFIMPSLRSVNSKSNLVMDLDFSNTASYSGTGAVVYNTIDASTAAANLVNSPTFTSFPKYVTFNGTNQYLIVTSNLSSKFSAITAGLNSSFTINIWMNPTTTNGNGVVLSELGAGNTSAAWHDAPIALVNGVLQFAVYPFAINVPQITSSIAIPKDNWYMVSLTYDGSIVNAYVNGVSAGSYGTLNIPFARQAPYNYSYGLYYCLACSDGTSPGSTLNGPFSLGRFKVYSTALNANDLLAIYNNEKGNFATYIGTSSATVTGATVNTQSPFSGGGNSYSTTGSTASYISIPGKSGLDFGTGDYTIEWFQYETDANAFPRPFWYGTSPNYGVSLEGGTFYYWPAGGANSMGSLGTWKNSWVHFAVVRIASKLYVYKNGTLISSATGVANTTNHTDISSNLIIGAKSGGLSSEQFGGYFTNFRIVKGLGVYTGNFTVPTSALTAITIANPYGGSNTQAIPGGYTSLLLVP